MTLIYTAQRGANTNLERFDPPLTLVGSRTSSFSTQSTSGSLNDFLDLYADEETIDELQSSDQASDNSVNDINEFNTDKRDPPPSKLLIKPENSSVSEILPKRENPSTVVTTEGIFNNNSQLSLSIKSPQSVDKVDLNKGDSNLLLSEEANNRYLQTDEIKNTFQKFLSNTKNTGFLKLEQQNSTIIEKENFKMQENIGLSDDIDCTLNEDNINYINTTVQSSHVPNTHVYTFDDSNEALNIDNSILEIIDHLGNGLNVNDEFELNIFPEETRDGDLQQVLTRSGSRHSMGNNIDLLSLEMSSEDEEYDDNERFKSFFELDYGFSSTTTNVRETTSRIIDTNNTEIYDNVSGNDLPPNINWLPSTTSPATYSLHSSNNSRVITDLDISVQPNIDINEALDADSIGTELSNKDLDIATPTDDPPPYSEIDLYLNTDSQTNAHITIFSNNDENRTFLSPVSENNEPEAIENQHDNSDISTISSSSKMKKRISIKVKKNSDGELSRHASVDYYQMERFLPPYRSLINPKKVYDYRTNTYLNTSENQIEIINRVGANSQSMVAIHKKKRDSRVVSMILTSNNHNNLAELLLDSANDNSSIRSKSISIRSIASKPKYKATAKFQDLTKDIRQRILSFVDNQRDLVSCLYVSTEFKEIVTPLLYKYPKFTSSYRLAQFVHTLMNNESLALIVKVFDLSNITFPVKLTEAEKLKYQDKLVYGTFTAIEVLNNKNKIADAGWRDFKFRNHPLYGDFNNWRKRANSGSTISSTNSSLETLFDKSLSTPNLLETKKNKNSYNRSRSNSGSDNVFKKKNVNGPRQRSNSSACDTNKKLPNDNNNNNSAGSGGGGFKSLKKAFGFESNVDVTKKKRGSSPVRKPMLTKKAVSANNVISTSNTVNTINNSNKKKRDSKVQVEINDRLPFSTTHPKINTMLKQFCFHRDIPVGYIIHVLMACSNLEEINFSKIIICNDYKLRDYVNFDWFMSTGVEISHSGQPRDIDENKPIFWSDTGRELNISDESFFRGYAESVSFKDIWKCIVRLKNIKILKLRKLNSLEQTIIKDFVMNSEFKETLEILDCSDSGMVRRDEWNYIFKAEDWREYFS